MQRRLLILALAVVAATVWWQMFRGMDGTAGPGGREGAQAPAAPRTTASPASGSEGAGFTDQPFAAAGHPGASDAAQDSEEDALRRRRDAGDSPGRGAGGRGKGIGRGAQKRRDAALAAEQRAAAGQPPFPGDFPLNPGAQVISDDKRDSGQRLVLSRSQQRGAEVVRYQRDLLRDGGWEIAQDLATPPSFYLTARRDGWLLILTVREEDGTTLISTSAKPEGPRGPRAPEPEGSRQP